RYGLGSKDTTPGQIISVFRNTEKERFTIGIIDDVTNLSLEIKENPVTTPEGTTNCKFWGLGADGTVGANKNSIKIIGDNTDMFAQAYFDYDSKKSGGVTISHLRFGHTPIRSTYLISQANFVACHCTAYIYKYNMVQDLVPGGTFLFNTQWSVDELDEKLPGQVKRYIAENNINFYIIDGVKIGKEIGLGKRINTVLQSAFFSLTKLIPEEQVLQLMKDAATKSYAAKGDDIVKMNHDAIDAGATAYVKVEVPESWKNAEDMDFAQEISGDREDAVAFVKDIQQKVNGQTGNTIPVSVVKKYADGVTPSGTAAFEKRGVATDVPTWNVDKCIQCNQCSYVCPHAAIRPVAMTEAEAAAAPAVLASKDMNGMPGNKFAIAVSVMDCTGCGSCANVCPVDALTMASFEENEDKQAGFDYAVSLPEKTDVIEKFKANTVKGSQFKQPLLEFSGACGGCGETPYAKLITQLFGDRMYIANATGCSSIWGNSSPSTPYTVNAKGQGPAWSNSLFEDAAEFGYGMLLAQRAIRDRLADNIDALVENTSDADVKAAAAEWKDTFNVGLTNGAATDKLVAALEKEGSDAAKAIVAEKDFLAKKSQWIFGGDGWAYDIGFGGLDHVIASGKDINIMIFDTEVYSNTGGQSSKSTPAGAIAQFAAGGKETKKKDLAGIAMSYGYVYVAQIAMGADMNQCVKAIAEAEAYPGPSIIIAYAPCINHGIKKGMAKAQTEEKLAVEAGYWFNFRFNPALAAEGKDAFSLDSKAPTGNFQEFLKGENRYAALAKFNPNKAAQLFTQSEKTYKERYDYLNKLVDLYKA
ncbi:MAG: pyruvate:ferredoxin (flavodoxin) oxidoreductase, partial [Lachnospiraceae bacterium]|nr:pyruvate:ferredoxin (flavodoxin) oxidoreductase [Lachnospiraceae bacterium]